MVGAAIECMPANSFARMRPARATIAAAQCTGLYAGQTISYIFALGISLLCITPLLMPYKGVSREYLIGMGNTSLDYLTGFDREPLCI